MLTSSTTTKSSSFAARIEWDGDPETFEAETVLDYVRESGAMGTLHPKSQSEFFSGPTSLTPNPVKIRVKFVRGNDGTVTGMEWNEGGVKRHLPRSTRYRKENVVFHNGETKLVGDLLLPAGAGPHPGVVLVHGTGPVRRGESYFIVADLFARHGFATLVYDKRGIGESGGDWRTAGPAELASDVRQALSWLRRHPRIKA